MPRSLFLQMINSQTDAALQQYVYHTCGGLLSVPWASYIWYIQKQQCWPVHVSRTPVTLFVELQLQQQSVVYSVVHPGHFVHCCVTPLTDTSRAVCVCGCSKLKTLLSNERPISRRRHVYTNGEFFFRFLLFYKLKILSLFIPTTNLCTVL